MDSRFSHCCEIHICHALKTHQMIPFFYFRSACWYLNLISLLKIWLHSAVWRNSVQTLARCYFSMLCVITNLAIPHRLQRVLHAIRILARHLCGPFRRLQGIGQRVLKIFRSCPQNLWLWPLFSESLFTLRSLLFRGLSLSSGEQGAEWGKTRHQKGWVVEKLAFENMGSTSVYLPTEFSMKCHM